MLRGVFRVCSRKFSFCKSQMLSSFAIVNIFLLNVSCTFARCNLVLNTHVSILNWGFKDNSLNSTLANVIIYFNYNFDLLLNSIITAIWVICITRFPFESQKFAFTSKTPSVIIFVSYVARNHPVQLLNIYLSKPSLGFPLKYAVKDNVGIFIWLMISSADGGNESPKKGRDFRSGFLPSENLHQASTYFRRIQNFTEFSSSRCNTF